MGILMDWVHDLPARVFGPLCILAFVLPTMAGLWLIHRKVHQRLRLTETLIDNGVVGWFFSAIFTIYGITLGLIAVTTWESYSHVSEIVSHEASSIAALYRDTAGFPNPLRDDLQQRLREYTRYLIDRVWPAQRLGESPTEGNRMLDEFESDLYSNEPASESQRILQTEALKAFNVLIEFRRQRIEAVGQGVPDVVWVVVLLGGALTIVTSFCFQLNEFKFHLLLSSGLAAMIGLLVFLIAAFDRPYRGTVSIDPTAYEIIYDGLMKNNAK
jgi:hypothetical protein